MAAHVAAIKRRQAEARLRDRNERQRRFEEQRAEAERQFLRSVEGGCRVPVACHSVIDAQEILVEGLIAREDGTAVIRKSLSGMRAGSIDIASRLAESVLAGGGEEILKSYDS